jgi:hypothetical protein
MALTEIEQVREQFRIERLSAESKTESFFCSIEEYTQFLTKKAFEYQERHISNTYLLIDRDTTNIVAYLSLIADSIRLTDSEKKKCGMDSISFYQYSAMKIAKLAVNQEYKKKYLHIGTFMIKIALSIAVECDRDHISCRFMTCDADIENNPTVKEFYTKNGFEFNEKPNKRKKTVSMRRDLFS